MIAKVCKIIYDIMTSSRRISIESATLYSEDSTPQMQMSNQRMRRVSPMTAATQVTSPCTLVFPPTSHLPPRPHLMLHEAPRRRQTPPSELLLCAKVWQTCCWILRSIGMDITFNDRGPIIISHRRNVQILFIRVGVEFYCDLKPEVGEQQSRPWLQPGWNVNKVQRKTMR